MPRVLIDGAGVMRYNGANIDGGAQTPGSWEGGKEAGVEGRREVEAQEGV